MDTYSFSYYHTITTNYATDTIDLFLPQEALVDSSVEFTFFMLGKN